MIDTLSSEKLKRGLDGFRNTKDKDIEDFLRFKALDFEGRHWCATYLLINVEAFQQDKLVVEGYFTLSNKVISITENISNSRRKKLFNGIKNDDTYLHVILIGQLAKYVNEMEPEAIYGDTSMEELLDAAFEIIELVNERIPCRCVLLECREASETDSEEEKKKRANLHKKYMDYGFSPLQKDDDLVQYVITV